MNPSAGGTFAGNPFLWPQAADGAQYEDIGNEAKYALSQTFLVGAADTYQLSWQDNTALNILPGFRTAPYSVTMMDSMATMVLFDTLDSYHVSGAWQTRSILQYLDVGSYTLTFTSLNQFNRTDTLIDAVSLSVAAAAVPEPATALIVVVGLGALVSASKLRKNAVAGASQETHPK